LEIVAEAGKSTRFMTPPSFGFKLLRNAVLSLSLTQEFVRPLYHWRTSRPHVYQHSALNCNHDDDALFTTGPGHGAPPQNILLSQDHYLLDALGGRFDFLVFTNKASIDQELVDVVDDFRAKGLPIFITAVSRQKQVAGADQTLNDSANRARQGYGLEQADGAYLLRPDQHVCARWLQPDRIRLKSALNALLNQ
jgi:3-(3-hydroxy-phenyl)propionate hydroxylase